MSTTFFAQRSANILSHTCSFEIDKESPFGESISGGNLSCSETVDRWYRQKKRFKNSKQKSGGLYTQIIWKKTKFLGCGVAPHCKLRFITVCLYYPPGNVKDEYEQNV
ncbi:hypothetical protein B4U79_18816 [Dinothrombium tinctorium]|uniref:SCP domain-containing protein n=1 Tax=Dinothrombium tinctorium TaxID=1965070 RepID=A0A3S3NB85_9ACAR|nr:hypothetical protein B4U79_18816 [Dinothrombium tinctorium]